MVEPDALRKECPDTAGSGCERLSERVTKEPESAEFSRGRLHKRLKILVFTAVALFALAQAAVASAATTLYPDLKTLPPRALQFDRADVGTGDSGNTGVHNVLRFTNTVWNSGQGPLVVSAHLDPATKRGNANQRIYDDAGNFTTVPT